MHSLRRIPRILLMYQNQRSTSNMCSLRWKLSGKSRMYYSQGFTKISRWPKNHIKKKCKAHNYVNVGKASDNKPPSTSPNFNSNLNDNKTYLKLKHTLIIILKTQIQMKTHIHQILFLKIT